MNKQTVGTVSVVPLPVIVGQEPSHCGRPPQGSSFLALGLGARPCLCLIGAVGLSLCGCVCVCVCLSPCLSGYLWRWEGWYVLSLLFLKIFIIVVVLLLKYERYHINKIWFDSIWTQIVWLVVCDVTSNEWIVPVPAWADSKCGSSFAARE